MNEAQRRILVAASLGLACLMVAWLTWVVMVVLPDKPVMTGAAVLVGIVMPLMLAFGGITVGLYLWAGRARSRSN
jgi:hypothetical protein